MSFVLDASVTLAWCFEDEASEATDKLLMSVTEEPPWVPSLWTLEIGNILTIAERKKRISYAQAIEFIELLNNLKIKIDEEQSQRAFKEIFLLAHAEQLTVYDATYLELAIRKGLPLATKDNQLSEAAKKLGVKLIKVK